jgi:hypothetical protein
MGNTSNEAGMRTFKVYNLNVKADWSRWRVGTVVSDENGL